MFHLRKQGHKPSGEVLNIVHAYLEIGKIIWAKRNKQLAHYFICTSPITETKVNEKQDSMGPTKVINPIVINPIENDLEDLIKNIIKWTNNANNVSQKRAELNKGVNPRYEN